MKKSSLISKVAITSLAAIAFSATALNSVHAADLIWDGTLTGPLNSNHWNSRETGISGVSFTTGDNLWFGSGGGSLSITNTSSDYTGKLKIDTAAGDIYTFSGDKLYFNGDVDITTVAGSSVIFNSIGKGAGSDNNDLDISINLNGGGKVYFKESTSSFAGKGKVIVGNGTTLIAGDDTAVDPGVDAGGITKSRVYNFGTIEYWRGGESNTLTGVTDSRNSQIIGAAGTWDGKLGNVSLGSMGAFEKYRDNVLIFEDNNAVRNTIVKLYEGTIKVGSQDENPAGVWGKGDLAYTRYAGGSVRLMMANDTILKVKHDQTVAWLDTSLTSGVANSGSNIIITGSDNNRDGLLHIVYPYLSDFTGITFQDNKITAGETHKFVIAYGLDGPRFTQAFTLGGSHTYTGPTFVLGDTTIKLTSPDALGAQATSSAAGSELWLLKGSKIDLNGVSLSKHLGLWGEENFGHIERPVYWRENAIITNTSATLATLTIPTRNENAPRYYRIEGNVRLEVTSGSYRIGIFTEGGKDPWGNPLYGVQKNTYTGGSYFGPEVGFLQLDTGQDPFGTGDVEWNGKHLNVRVPGATIHGILYMNSKGRNDTGYSHHRIDLEAWHGAQLIVNGIGGKLHREVEVHNRGEFVLDGDYSKYTWVIGHQNDDAQTPYSTYTSDDKNYLNKGYFRLNAARLTVDDGRKMAKSAIKLSPDDPDGTVYWAPIRLEGGYAFLNIVGDMTGVKALMNPLSFMYEDSRILVQEGFTLEAKGQLFAEALNNGREKGFYKLGLGKMIIAGQFGGKFADLNTQEREQLSELRVIEGTVEFASTATFLHKNDTRMWYIVGKSGVLDVSNLGLTAAAGKFENSGKMIGDLSIIAGDTSSVWMNELVGNFSISGGRTLTYANKISGNFAADATGTTISQIGSIGGSMTLSNGVIWNLNAENNNAAVTGAATISDSTIKLTSLHLLKSGDVLFRAGTGSTFTNVTVEGLSADVATKQTGASLDWNSGNVIINLTNTVKEVDWDGATTDWNMTDPNWGGAAFAAKSITTFGSGQGTKAIGLSSAINASDVRVVTAATDNYTIGSASNLLTVDYAIGVSGAGKLSLVNAKTKNLTITGTAQLTTNGSIVDDLESTVLVKGGTWNVSGTAMDNPEVFANLILDGGTVKGTPISATTVSARSGVLDINFANNPTITKTTAGELKLGGFTGSGRFNLEKGKVTMTAANVGGGKTVFYLYKETVLDINGFDQNFWTIGAEGNELHASKTYAQVVNNSNIDATITIQQNTGDRWELTRFAKFSDGTGTGKLSLAIIGRPGNGGRDGYQNIELGTNYYTGDTYIGNHASVKFYETRPFGSGGTVNLEIGQNYTQLVFPNSGDFHADLAHKIYEVDNSIHFVNNGISSADPVFARAMYEGDSHLSSQYIAGFWTEQWVTTTITGGVTGDAVKVYFRGSGTEEDRIIFQGDFNLDSNQGIIFVDNTFVSFGNISGFKEVLKLNGGGNNYRYTGVEFRENVSLKTDIWLTERQIISIFPGKTVILKGNISQSKDSETNGWGEYWDRWAVLNYGGTLVLASDAPNPILNNAAGIRVAEDGDFNATTIQLGDGVTPGIGFFPGDIQLNAGDSVLVFNRPEDYSLIDVGGKRGRASDSGGALFNQNVAIEGKGSVVKKGAGMLTLVRDHSYTGETIIEAGSLRLASQAVMPEATREMAMATSKYTVNAGTKLIFDLDQYTLNNGIFHVEAGVMGAGNIEQWSGNTEFVSVAYTGSTLVTKGTMTVLGGNFLSSSVTIGDGAMLDLKGRPVYGNTFSSAGSFGGSLNLSGAGKLTGGLGNVVGNATLANVGTLAINTSSTIGKTEIGGNMNISGTNNILFRLSGENGVGTSDTVKVGKNLSITGTNTIKLSVFGELVNGTYTLFDAIGSVASTATLDSSGFRAGDVTLATVGKKIQLTVNITAHNLLWEGASAAWDTSAANWEDNSVSTQKFYAADNVTFDATGVANKTIAVNAGGVSAGDMIVSIDGYGFTGGSISAKSLDVGAGTVTFGNAGFNVANDITIASGAKVKFGLTGDAILTAALIGAGDLEQSGTKNLIIQSDVTGFTGNVIVSGGSMDITGKDLPVILNGGLLKSTTSEADAVMTKSIDVTANGSGIDLGNVMWVGRITGTDLYNLSLKSSGLGLFQNTEYENPTYFTNGSVIANMPTTTVGEVVEITTLNLENVEFNRPIKPFNANSIITVTGKESELGTYANIDLTGGGKLTLDVAAGTKVAAWNFLQGDGTFVKTGKGTLEFGSVEGSAKEYAAMNFSGTILVEEGLLDVTRSGVGTSLNNLFDGVDGRVTAIVKGGAILKGRLGDTNTDKTPIYKLEGSHLNGMAVWQLVSDYTYVKDLEMTNGRIRGNKIGVMFNSENDPTPVTSTFKIFSEGGVDTTSYIDSTLKLSFGNLDIVTDDAHSILQVNGTLERNAEDAYGSNSTAYTLRISGPGKVILAGSTSAFGNTDVQDKVIIDAGATLQAGVGADSGGITKAAVENNGTIIDLRNNNHDWTNVVSGSGSVIKKTEMELLLNAINTYTGKTTIESGSIKIGASGGIDSSIGGIEIQSEAKFDLTNFNESGGYTSVAAISNDGSITGALNIAKSLNNTATAKTEKINIVNGGSLQGFYAGGMSGSVTTISNGGTLQVGMSGVATSNEIMIVGGGLTLSGGQLTLDVDNTSAVSSLSDKIQLDGKLTVGTEKTYLNLVNHNSGSDGVDGTYSIMTGVGMNSYTAAQLKNAFKLGRAVLDFGASDADNVIVAITGSANLDLLWSGEEGKTTWANDVEASKYWKDINASNNPTYFVTNDRVIFDATATAKTVTVDAAGVIAAKMKVTGAAYTFTGTGGITVADAAGVIIEADGTATFNNSGTNSFVKVDLQTATSTLNLGENQTSANYIISGLGNFEKSGTSVLDVSSRVGPNANTYMGKTTISGGTLKIASLDNISALNTEDIGLNGGTLQTTASVDLSNAGTRTLVVGANGGSISVDPTFTAQVLLGAVNGSFTKLGTGDLEISGTTAFTKSVNINGGKVTIGAAGSFADLNGLAGATLDVGNTALIVQNGNFAGTIANWNKLIVKHLDSGISGHSFKYTAGVSGIDVEVEDGSTLEANVVIGAGKTLIGGTDVNGTVVTAIKGNLTLDSGSVLHIADNVSSGNGIVGVLKVDGNITLSNSNFHESVNFGTAIDQITATGTLSLDKSIGTTKLAFEADGANWGNTSYTLASFGTLDLQQGGDIKDYFIIDGLTRKEVTYTNAGNKITITVELQSAEWDWTGTHSGQWNMNLDMATNPDWSAITSNPNPNKFAAGDNAYFQDGASTYSVHVDGDTVTAGNQGVEANKVYFRNTSGNDYTFTGGSISAAQMHLEGTGKVTLNNTGNTISEALFIKNGELVLGVDGALVNSRVDMSGNGKLTNADGTTNTIKQLNGTGGTVSLSGTSATTLKVESGTYSGKIIGNNNSILEKIGNGSWTVSGLNTGAGNFDGVLKITEGNVNLAGNNTLAKLDMTSGTASSLTLGGNLTLTDGTISGSNRIIGTGNITTKGTVTLGGNNNFVGSLTVESGTTSLGSATALNPSTGISIKAGATFDLNGNNASAAGLSAEVGSTVALNGGATLTSNSSSNSSFDGDLTGNGKLVKEGTGILTLSSTNNNFSGGLDINGGAVSISDDRNLGQSDISIGDGGKLIYTATTNSSGRDFTINGKSGIETASGVTATIGDIIGSGTIIKSGDGILVLGASDNNAYTGSYNIKGGTLKASNFDIELNDGQVLSGVGTVDANVIVNSGGKLAPGNSVGHQTITGNVDLNDGAILDFEVSNVADGSLAGISSSDRLNILGDLNTSGSITLNVAKEGNSMKFTEEIYNFLIVDLVGDFNGNLADINVLGSGSTLTNDYRLSLFVENGDLYLNMKIIRPDYFNYVNSDNADAVAQYLDDGWSAANTFWKTDVANQVRAIGGTNPGAVSTFLNQLSGYTLAHATQSRELSSDHFRQLWSQRLTTGAASKFSANQSVKTINSEEANTPVKFTNIDSVMKESYWAQPFSYYTNMKSEKNVSGYDYKSYGITGGYDTRWDTGYVGGLAFFYETADVDVKKNSDRSDIDDTRVAVFGGWESENITLIASASYGIQRYESKRTVQIGELGGHNKSEYDGNTYGASIDFTAKMTEKLRLIAGFDYENISRDSFQEKKSDFAMNVKKEDYDTYASRLGIRYDVNFSDATVYGLVAWKHRFDSTESEITGSYTGVAGEFTAKGLSPVCDSALLGLGTEYDLNTHFSIFADVNADLGSGRADVGANIGARFNW